MIAMAYGHVYVASISMGANKVQTIKALKEAESYEGPSLILAYSPCIEHGIKVFDTTTFTIGGAPLTNAFALDTDGDFAPDSKEAVFDGCFNESYFQSAPYFALQIDGIEWLNSAF